MHDDARAGLQHPDEDGPGALPCQLEAGIWRLNIRYRQVKPAHAGRLDPLPKVGQATHLELVLLDQGDDCCGAPPGDHVEIGTQVPLPRSAEDAVALFAGAEGQPQPLRQPNQRAPRRSTLKVKLLPPRPVLTPDLRGLNQTPGACLRSHPQNFRQAVDLPPQNSSKAAPSCNCIAAVRWPVA